MPSTPATSWHERLPTREGEDLRLRPIEAAQKVERHEFGLVFIAMVASIIMYSLS
jgi:hypothetical protein